MADSGASRFSPVQPQPPSAPTPPESAEAAALHPNLQRALGAFRLAMPFVQKLLPLLDGHLLSTVSSVLAPPTPQPSSPQQAPSPTSLSQHPQERARIDLAPVENKLERLQKSHIELSGRIAEQNGSLKRVEDQLEMVREATDRNTLEQQELLDDLKNIGHKVNIVTLVILAMLLGSLLLNLILYLHIQRVLP